VPLKASKRGSDGITVPYGPIFDDIRSNNGFTDLRGRPDLAETIVEGSSSESLRRLLVRIAKEDAYFSLGCDLGVGRPANHEAHDFANEVAGGYIQVSAIKYRRPKTAQYDRFIEVVASRLADKAEGWLWLVDFDCTFVRFKLRQETPITRPSVWMWFFAEGGTEALATQSREALISAISDVLHMPDVVAILTDQKQRRAG
jgi:hypothetical protein